MMQFQFASFPNRILERAISHRGDQRRREEGQATILRRRYVTGFPLRSVMLAIVLAPVLAATVAAQTGSLYPSEQPEPSTASKLSSSVKSGFSKVTNALIPKGSVKKAPDPISLSVPAEESAELHVAVARMAEQADNPAKAEYHYRKAIKLDPTYVDALMGYAHMLDRQGKLAQAADLYRMAIGVVPNNPKAHNDLGICYARQGRLDEAVASLEKAIQLLPKQARYRNNLATILVQANQPERAFTHLCAVHPRGIACYNLGYLMQKAGDQEKAIRLFEQALAIDPSLSQARVWLTTLRPAVAGAEKSAPGAVREPQAVARRAAPMPQTATASPVAVPSAAPMPPSTNLAPLPQIPVAVPNQTQPGQLAPMPSLKPLPPIQRNY